MQMSEEALRPTEAELIERLEAVIEAALRQLSFMGKGKEPSPRLQAAIDEARQTIASVRGS